MRFPQTTQGLPHLFFYPSGPQGCDTKAQRAVLVSKIFIPGPLRASCRAGSWSSAPNLMTLLHTHNYFHLFMSHRTLLLKDTLDFYWVLLTCNKNLQSLRSNHTQNCPVSSGLTGHSAPARWKPSCAVCSRHPAGKHLYFAWSYIYPGLSIPTGFPKMGRNLSISTQHIFLLKSHELMKESTTFFPQNEKPTFFFPLHLLHLPFSQICLLGNRAERLQVETCFCNYHTSSILN